MYGNGGKYCELFLAALRQYGMLCVGIYRYTIYMYLNIQVCIIFQFIDYSTGILFSLIYRYAL